MEPGRRGDTTVDWRWTIGSLVTVVARAGFRLTHLVGRGDAHDKTGLPSGLPGEFVLLAVKE